MAIPVRAAAESESAVVGVILLTIAPSPPMILFTWPTLLFGVVLTGLLLLAAVFPWAPCSASSCPARWPGA
jgi:hypothetical protein